MRSMFSGVSGLKVHQMKMDVIGNNIANVNTTGFKSSRVTFSEMFYQNLSGASQANKATGRGGVNPMQVGLGVNLSTIDNIMTEGAAQRTDNPFDLKVEGEGFVIVKKGNEEMFTRAGNLYIDGSGNLVGPGGIRIQGWTTRTADDPMKIDTSGGRNTLNEINILAGNSNIPPNATTEIQLDGNLNINKDTVETTASVVDSLGQSYEVKITFTKNTVNAGQWDISMSGPTGVTVPAAPTPASVTFDAQGKLPQGTELTFNLTGFTNGATSPQAITLPVDTLTQYNNDSTLQVLSTDGYSSGTLMNVSIGPDGSVMGLYSNGELQALGKIALAVFNNPYGLEKVGGNLFRRTANSGVAEVNAAGEGGAGSFNAGVLEMSNVDLAKEFTEMITTQRGFQANSKIITTSDEMLHELVNLKR